MQSFATVCFSILQSHPCTCIHHSLAYRDADWNLKDIQQHLVRTQRQQTANNKAFLGHIQRLDSDIEDLMKQVWFI